MGAGFTVGAHDLCHTNGAFLVGAPMARPNSGVDLMMFEHRRQVRSWPPIHLCPSPP